MLYSVSHRFIFVRYGKAGSQSIRAVLRRYQPFYRKNRYVEYALRKTAGFWPEKFRIVPVHANAQFIREKIGHEVFDSFFTFGFIRNPWDYAVSQYFYILRRKDHPSHNEVSQFKTFDEFIEWHVVNQKRSMKDFHSDENGNIIVDFIGKFENLNEDFEYVTQKIGLKGLTLPHLNKTNHRDFRTYYTDYSAELIAKHYKEDIAFFGYQFEEGATP